MPARVQLPVFERVREIADTKWRQIECPRRIFSRLERYVLNVSLKTKNATTNAGS